jgi:adenine-specific DNA glycosylase
MTAAPPRLPTPEAVRAARRRLLRWYGVHKRDLPWRHSRDPYAIWVSEVMLQQTRVETVRDRWQLFLDEFPDVATLAAAEEQAVLKAWEGLGYYRRARFLHRRTAGRGTPGAWDRPRSRRTRRTGARRCHPAHRSGP